MKSPTEIHSNSGVYVAKEKTKEKQKLTEIKNKLQHKIGKKSAVKNEGP